MSYIQEIVEKMTADINHKKEQIIKDKLLKHGITIDFEKEERSKFKKIVCVHENGNDSETYYYNDGSEEGLRIVTFTRKMPTISKYTDPISCIMTEELYYY